MDEADVLERLVAPYSPSGNEGPAVSAFVSLARTLGYRARVDRVGNGVAERGRGRPELLFLGHIDTVEGDRPVRRARGRVHGRGWSTRRARSRRHSGPAAVRRPRDVPDRRRRRRGDRQPRGPPSSLRPQTGCGHRRRAERLAGGHDRVQGELRLEATFRGRRTHYASPFPTAADRAVDWIDVIRTVVAARQAESPFRSLSAKAIGFESRPGRTRSRLSLPSTSGFHRDCRPVTPSRYCRKRQDSRRCAY